MTLEIADWRLEMEIGDLTGSGKNMTLGEAPKKCSTFLGGFSHKIIITSTTPIVTPEFSSDLERAPGARSAIDCR